MPAWFQRFPRLPAMLVLAAIVLALNLPTLHSVKTISIIDEREHLDNMLRASHGEIGHNGQLLTQETLRELCTRGSELFNWPPCKPGRLNPLDYAPETDGRNVSTETPPYAFVTGLSARALRAVTPGPESLVTWGRVLGSVWLLIGMYLVLRIGDLLDIDRKPLVVALVLVAALPAQLHASTTVNPDGIAFLVGAAVFLAAVAWERRGASVVWFVVASTLAVWIHEANAVAVLVALIYLGLRTWASARSNAPHVFPSWQRYAAASLAVAVCGLAVLGGWRAIERPLRPTVSTVAADHPETSAVPPPQTKPIRGLPIRLMLSKNSLFAMVPPVFDTAPPNVRNSAVGKNADWYATLTQTAFLFLVAVFGASILAGSGGGRLRLLAVASLITLIIAAPLNQLFDYYVNGYWLQTPPRFGLSALPMIAVLCAAVTWRTRVGRVALIVVAGGLYTTALLTLL